MFQFVDFAFGNADEDRTSSLRVCFTFSLSPCSRPGPSPQIDAALACRPLTKATQPTPSLRANSSTFPEHLLGPCLSEDHCGAYLGPTHLFKYHLL
jgi:hypothetical protein